MGCGCRKRIRAASKKEKANPVSPTQKRMVHIHVWKEEQKSMCEYLTNDLDSYKIKWDFIVDKKPLNRGYPYMMVNNQIFCIKRIVEAFKRNEL